MKVIWSEAAEADLRDILVYVAADDFDAAFRLVERLEAAGNALEDFPLRGRPGRASGTRVVVPRTKYLLVYEINDNRLDILRVMHGARDWPPPTDDPAV